MSIGARAKERAISLCFFLCNQAMWQTWTLGREHCFTAASSKGKKASTAGRLSEVGSARKSEAERAALAMASSGEVEEDAMAVFERQGRAFR
jgi:hypothetical protein